MARGRGGRGKRKGRGKPRPRSFKRKPSVTKRGKAHASKVTKPKKLKATKTRNGKRVRLTRVERNARKVADAVRTLEKGGFERVRGGRITLARTPFRGLGKASYAALERDLKSVKHATRANLRRVSVSFTVRDPTGKVVFKGQNLAVPDKRVKQVRALMRERGWSEAKATRHVLALLVYGAVGREVRLHRGLFYEKRGAGIRMKSWKGSKAVAEELRRAHRAQGFSFSVELGGEV